jgi:hypothetical protein
VFAAVIRVQKRRLGAGQSYHKKVRHTRHTSHVTHHTSHVTRHTSHITRHTSHVTRHTSHVTRYMSHVTRHTSHITRHTSHVTRHTSHVTRHTLHVTRHTLHVTRHTSCVTRHTFRSSASSLDINLPFMGKCGKVHPHLPHPPLTYLTTQTLHFARLSSPPPFQRYTPPPRTAAMSWCRWRLRAQCHMTCASDM